MAKRPSWIGQTLGGRYKIEKLLGQGGMSAVYQANDPNLRRTVAIKLIHSHLATDEQFVRRFEEEAAAVAQLRHPHIIQVYDFNHDDDIYYMVLEFLPGETLGDRQERLVGQSQRLSIGEVLQAMIKLADAVHYAHDQGMIHRDLKPANVMIRDDGNPVLMDFGIVKMVQNASHTASGVIMGTMAYMAPEQIRGEQIDHRIDIYALGVILFEMLIGRKPFDGESTVTTMMKHLNEPPPDLIELDPEIPYEVAEVVYKALEKEPDKRFGSAAEMGQALRYAGVVLGIIAASEMGGTAVGTIASDATEIYEPLNTFIGESMPTVPHQRRKAIATEEVATNNEKQDIAMDQGLARLLANNWAIGSIVFVVLLAIAAVTLGQRRMEQQRLALAATQAAQTIVAVEATTTAAAIAAVEATQVAQATAIAQATEDAILNDPANLDDDGDGLNNAIELEIGTNPNQSDSDTDGLTDFNENAVPCLDPTSPDTDGDGLIDSADDSPCEAAVLAPDISAQIVSIDIDEFVPTGSSGRVGYGNDPYNNDLDGTNPDSEPTETAEIDNEPETEDRYVVTFETDGFIPAAGELHVHFYYNIVAEEDSGLPGAGPWEIHPNPDPFTLFKVADRPAEATEICVIVARGDHRFIADSGSCTPIPDR